MAGREEDQVSHSYPKGDLESPFLHEALFVGEQDAGWQARLAAFEAENPFSHLGPINFEEEIIGRDERSLVTDTLKVPNRWVCAIDILIDNPKWGSATNQPRLISKSRGTGILIGPRYVLTARHLMEKQTVLIDGEHKSVEVKGLVISPARNGNNSASPLGNFRSKAVRVSRPYRIRRTVRQGSRSIEIPIQQQDDYMLIILENDLDSRTHSRMNGLLGYWGQDPTTAILRCLEPKDIQGKTIVVTGYPGDTCGKDRFSGSKPEKTRKIENCWNWQRDVWASTQWKGAGTLEIVGNSSTVLHTADTYEGQSGAPICLTVDNKYHLVGIHTGSENSSRNNGVRVTRRMLGELVAWINEDAGSEIASIQDDSLVIRSKGTPGAGAKELAEFEDPSPAIPMDVALALAQQDWPLALKLAIQAGWRDENQMADLIFFTRHSEFPDKKLDPKHPKFKQLGAEWATILNREVWKAIQESAENKDLMVSGKEVSDHHRTFFRGKSGKILKKLVEDTAREVDINPGLLGTIMMAETRRPRSYLSSEKVSSYHIGCDDFYEGRSAIEARVPAYKKVKWDKKQVPDEHLNDAKTNRRMVKTILFDSGKDAVLATAVYLKFREVRLREVAAEAGGDFDSLSLPTRMALTRMAMAAGTGGATKYLKDALNGVDIFVREKVPVRAYQTKRNATVRTAQAMHLSDWAFGIVVEPASLPGVKELEGLGEEEEQESFFTIDPELEEAEEAGEGAGDEEDESPFAIDPEFEEAEEAEGEVEDQESLDPLDPELEEAEEAEGSNEEGEQENRSGFEFEPELGEKRSEDWVDFEPETEWEYEELWAGEQSDIFQHDVPKKDIREVVVGERIELDLSTTAFGADLDKVQWVIPGVIVAGYRGTGDKAKVFKLSALDLEKPKVSFFWVNPRDNRTVVARILTKSGARKEFSVVFNVKGPTIKSFKGTPGKNHIFKNHGMWVLKFGNPGVELGIRWDWQITMPPNRAGFIQDLQTVSGKRSKTMFLLPGKKETRKLVWRHPARKDAHVQLDGTWDEKPEKDPFYTRGLAEESHAAGELVEGGASDSPETELESLGRTVSINDRFVYYILFKPATDKPQDAIWVPVARAKWTWEVTAIQRGGKWKNTKMDMTPDIEKKTVKFPIYESFGGENQWLED
jgi:V8-like Glu-specific endopeptidase